MRPITENELYGKWSESENTLARMREVNEFVKSGEKLAELRRFIPSIQSEVQIYRKCFKRVGFSQKVKVHVNKKRIIVERIDLNEF